MEILSLVPDTVFKIGPIAVTNAHLALMLVTLLIAIFGLYVAGTARLVPTRAQTAMELSVFWLYDRIRPMVADRRYANFVFALIATIFLTIVVSNLFFLLPLSSIVFETAKSHGELFRVPTSHLSLTLALGVMVVILSHVLALSISPWRQINHFVRIDALLKTRSVGGALNALLEVFLGILEIIGQISRVISISARLFGNIFAGEVMVAVIIKLTAATGFIVPIPFYALNIFVGVIQAMVFTLLSAQYIGGMIEGVATPHGEH